jgi:hypothetical protein
MMLNVAHAALLLTAAAQIACGAAERDPNEAKAEIEVTGCLAGSDDRFVLTELDRADTATTIASPSTEIYRLIGDVSVLRQHVGQEVRVSGMAETPDVAIVRESSPASPPSVGTGGDQTEPGAAPKVVTGQQTRIETSSLQVRSVTPTGNRCGEQ